MFLIGSFVLSTTLFATDLEKDATLEQIWSLREKEGMLSAVKHLEEYLKAHPDHLRAHTELGWMYAFDSGQREEARKEFDFILKQAASLQDEKLSDGDRLAIALAHTGLGGMYLEEGNFDLAEQELLVSNDVLPTPSNYSFLGDLALRYRKDYKFCVQFHQKALELNPNDQAETVEIATCSVLSGDPRKADQLFQTVNVNDERNAFSLAQYFAVVGNNKKSLEHLDQVIKRFHDAPLRQNQLFPEIKSRRTFSRLVDTREFNEWETKYKKVPVPKMQGLNEYRK